MEPDGIGSFIEITTDYTYTRSDRMCFPVCFTCGEFSPFMVYLGYNEKCIKFQPNAGRAQLFCPVCAPDPDHIRKCFPGEQLYRADSILNDRKFLDLLSRYEYSNPYCEMYSNVDRIIITENTQLCAAYKTVAKRKAPKTFKMKLLMNLFPAAHRLPNKKYSSTEDLCENMMQKYHDICISYMTLSETGGSQLLDNFDILIDRTPMGERQINRKTVPFRVPDSDNEATLAKLTDSSVANNMLNELDDEIRAIGSDSDDDRASIASGVSNRHTHNSSNTLQLSSQSRSGGISILPSSQSQSQRSQFTNSSGSVNISSQSINQPGAADISTTSSANSDSDNSSTSIYTAPPRTGRRIPPTTDDEEAGPSNVKRRRVTFKEQNKPVNPTPEAIRDKPIGRLPRLDGG